MLPRGVPSGHHRWNAVKAAGLTSVPVTLFQSDDELDILEMLIESNRQPTKDNEQVGREADALMGIEKERAKRRQAEQTRQNQPQAKKTNDDKSQKVESVPPSEKAKARDTVGEKVGMSGKTAEQSAFCIRVMDALGRIGKTVEAHQVRQLLRRFIALYAARLLIVANRAAMRVSISF